MRSPSWVELAGRNAAAEAVCVSASMRITGHDGDQVLDEQFDFWHGPGGLWRIERDGEVVYRSTADGGTRSARARLPAPKTKRRHDAVVAAAHRGR